jgi:hypothetical protein
MSSYSSLNRNAANMGRESNGIKYNEANLTMYHVIRNKKVDDSPVYLNDDIGLYIDMFFTTESKDFTKPFAQRKTEERIEAKQCTQDDFGNEPILLEYFKSWEGYSLICPVVSKDITIQGEPASMI